MNKVIELGSGNVLQFKDLVAGTFIDLVSTGSDVTINATGSGGGGEANTASNLGSGEGLFTVKSGVDLPFKSLVQGVNVVISSNGSEVTISSTGTGDVTSASNLGVGEGVFAQKAGSDLEFKSLVPGDSIELSSTGTDVSIGVDGEVGVAGSGTQSFIWGGSSNSIGFSSSDSAAIVGGINNTIPSGNPSFNKSMAIVGGTNNTISGYPENSAIVGGIGNSTTGQGSAVLGGQSNSAAIRSGVLAGLGNSANGVHTAIVGGESNSVTGFKGAVVGGFGNIVSADSAVVVGGEGNTVTVAKGAVIGGTSCAVTAGNSLAAGNRAKAVHGNSFVWADGTSADFSTTGTNQYAIRASGGARFETAGSGLSADKAVFASLSYPTADGTSGQFLKTNGAGVLSFATAGTSTTAANVGPGEDIFAQQAGSVLEFKTLVQSGSNVQISSTGSTVRIGALNVLNWVSVPALSSDPGAVGDVALDSNFFYVYVGTSWKRSALGSW